MVDLLVKGGTVITMDKRRRVIRDGAIAVEGDKILSVGKKEEVEKDYGRADRVVDAEGEIVLPGLINPHNHFVQILVRSLGDNLAWKEWLSDFIYPVQESVTDEDCYVASLLACAEMIKSGITFSLDNNDVFTTSHSTDKIAQAVVESGMKCVLAPGPPDLGDYAVASEMTTEKAKSICIEVLEKWHNKAGGRIKVWFGPITIGVTHSGELACESAQLAVKFGTKMILHLAETMSAIKAIREEYGFLGHVEYANDIGVLGPQTVAAHCVWISDREIEILKNTSTSVVHSPTSNAIVGSGICPAPRLLARGVTVALGTDGPASNNSLSMFREMRMASYIHRALLADPTIMSAEKVLEMATLHGAKVLGLQKDIGSIEPGKKADIITISLKRAGLAPILRPVHHIVYQANENDVDNVIVDGKIIMEDRHITTVDENKVIEAAQNASENLIERSGVQRLLHCSF